MINLWYAGIPFHQLGNVRIVGESAQPQPDDNPQQWLKTLSVTVDFIQSTYADNHKLYRQIETALRTQHGTLKWSDVEGDSENVWLDQTATVRAHDFPEDANAWGTYRQRISVSFQYFEEIDATHLITATFLRTGMVGSPLVLGNVIRWKESLRSRRFDDLHKPRSLSTGLVTATGRFKANPADTLATRRGALLTLKELWLTECNGASGQLTHGASFDRTVKIDDFTADVDQASDYIEWSLSANFTRFPDETNYAVAEFKTTTRENLEDGESILQFTGSIGATTKAVALAKLDLVRTAMLAGAGFTALQKTESQIEDENVSVSPPTGSDSTNTDGDAFIRITFSESYRKKISNVLSWNVRESDQDDVRTGLLRTTYSGSVTATAATSSAAYTAARDRALLLAANKYQMLIGSTLTADYRRIGTTTSGETELVRLEFNYEYQRHTATRAYIEVNTETATEPFGRHTTAVSGYIVAANKAAAQLVYTTKVKSLFTSSLILNESITSSEQRISLASGVGVVSNETSDGSYVTQQTRFEFRFTAHRTRTGLAGMRYEMDVSQDFIALEKTTTLSGSVFAASEDGATSFLDGYLRLSAGEYRWGSDTGPILGKRLASRRVAQREVGTNGGGGPAIAFAQLNFTETFKTNITSVNQIIECDLSEEIQFSGRRLVPQPILDGNTVVQDTGVTEGRRTIQGQVKALTETAAVEWIRKQMNLPFPTWLGAPATPPTRYVNPPTVSIRWSFMPLTDGIGRTGTYGSLGSLTANLQVCVGNFSFTETLTDYGWA